MNKISLAKSDKRVDNLLCTIKHGFDNIIVETD